MDDVELNAANKFPMDDFLLSLGVGGVWILGPVYTSWHCQCPAFVIAALLHFWLLVAAPPAAGAFCLPALVVDVSCLFELLLLLMLVLLLLLSFVCIVVFVDVAPVDVFGYIVIVVDVAAVAAAAVIAIFVVLLLN